MGRKAAQPTTAWGCYLMAQRQKMKSAKWPYKNTDSFMGRDEFCAWLNKKLRGMPFVAVWTYIRWEMGTHTPREETQARIRAVLEKAIGEKVQPVDKLVENL